MNKVGKTKTISFAVGNLDVYDRIQEKSNGSQYICDAVRFYEKYKKTIEKQKLQDINNFDRLIEDKVEEILIERSMRKPIHDKNKKENLDTLNKDKKEEKSAITNINDIGNKNIDAIRNFYIDQNN